MNAYDLASVKLPRLTGRSLQIFAGVLENAASRALFLGKIQRDAGVETFRALSIQEAPVFLPLWTDRSAAGTTPLPPLDELVREDESPFLGISSFARAYRQRQTTPLIVAEHLIAAIEERQKGDRPLGAFIAQNRADLLAQARVATERIHGGRAKSWFDGVPIGVKDELDQTPYPSTVGTCFLGKEPAKEDATVVARLRAAGAMLIGKLNMNEIGINPDGGNMNHGLVRNPYHLDHDTGGSSSGSAAAVAVGFCPGAIGADGGGSIRIPAALCGVVGLKATFGRISEHGAAPLCWSVAHVGPIGATTADVALMYAVIAGADPKDLISLQQPAPCLERFADDDLRGVKIGVYRPWFEHASPDVVRACRAAIASLEERGAVQVEVEIPGLNAMRVAHAITILSEMASAMGDHRAELCLPTRINMALGRAFSSTDYVLAQRVRAQAMNAFARAFERCDVIATPSTAITAPKLAVSRAKEGWSDLESVTEVMRYAFAANLTGLPAVSVPAGYDSNGLPIGAQLTGKPWSEHTLLRLARIIEQKTPRKVPSTYARLF